MGTLIVEWTNTWLERGGSKEYTSKISRGYVASSGSANIFCFVLCKNMQKIPPNCNDVECTELRTSSVTPETICNGKIPLLIKKKFRHRLMQLWKKGMVNRRIFHWHEQFTQGQACASSKTKSRRPVVASAETTVNTMGTMLADDDSSLQWQIALAMKKISFLSCNFRRGVHLRFYAKRLYGHSICIIGLIFSQVM